MNPIEFQQKWIGGELKECSAAQEHFLDLCRVLDHSTPAELDRDGAFFTFERGATKSIGGQGWADVWYGGHFAREYKGPHKDLVTAHDQLLGWSLDTHNPMTASTPPTALGPSATLTVGAVAIQPRQRTPSSPACRH